MNIKQESLFKLSGAFAHVIIFIKFFLVVIVAIYVLYDRLYWLGILIVIFYVLLTAVDVLISHYFRNLVSKYFQYNLALISSIYLIVFGFVFAGIPSLIASLELKKKNH